MGAVDLIEELGGSAQQIADDAGLPQQVLYDQDMRFEATAVLRFYELAAAHCGCRHFGILLASRSGWQVLGPIWLVMRQAKTIRSALNDLADNFEFFTTAVSIDLQPDPIGLVGFCEPRADFRFSTIQAIEFTVAIAALEIGRIAGEKWRPWAVQFRHSAPQSMAVHRKVFGPNVSFEQDRNAITLDTKTLELPVASSEVRGHDIFAAHLRGGATRKKLIEEHRVEAAIRALLPHSQCNLPSVARLLGMSERALQHHLQQRGQSFQKIFNQVRIAMAEKYLRQSNLRISQISELLQYSETSAFSRFVKTQLGSSPRDIREQREAPKQEDGQMAPGKN